MWDRKYRNTVSSSPENKKLYKIRTKMIERCTNPNCDRYKDYGGRGIKICDEWLNDYDSFVDWSKMNGYKEGLSIDRIDNNGNYEPSNCRWITKREQNRNKRTNKMVTYKGETKPLIVWCEELGLKYDPIHNRLEKRWDVEKAFTKPLRTARESFQSICRRHNINPTTARDRMIKFGWSFEDALNTPSVGRTSGNKDYFRDKWGKSICQHCGKEFLKHTKNQIYCSTKCREDEKKIRSKKTA